MPPTSRFNIDTSTIAELHDEAFGADIQVTNAVPIIVEESMYWDSNGFLFSGGGREAWPGEALGLAWIRRHVVGLFVDVHDPRRADLDQVPVP